ncbi:MAG TPA: glycosyltransferase family A protein [Candidatus Omnitrophota bacterium]|jgi:glycosyltransferase involved in cell wall biosynthesis|nr:glycosyltransferase family A protein [Candidatus Omnitrophota bacterium]HPW64992.1 glycosyltransferase family A protein [Candidatus Omnitrophota bacterium]
MESVTSDGTKPLVSVIIPFYNRAHVLPRAVDSVLAQRGCNFELILVDDGSTDAATPGHGAQSTKYGEKATGRHTVLRAPHSVPVRWISQSNKGPSAARNLGIRHAHGKWIAFLDSDDEWKPGKLKAQMKFFEENPDYRICQTEEIWVRNGVRVNPMKKHKKYGGWIFEKCLPLCVVSPSAVMMHRTLLDEIGLFDESLPACEDYDLWLRIASRYPVGLIEKPYLIKYGGHADQRSREFPAMDRFRIRSLVKLLREGFLTPEQTLAARKTLEEKSRIFIRGALKHGNRKEAGEIQRLIAESL